MEHLHIQLHPGKKGHFCQSRYESARLLMGNLQLSSLQALYYKLFPKKLISGLKPLPASCSFPDDHQQSGNFGDIFSVWVAKPFITVSPF
ncbi:hypothetical protein [Desulfatiglans anilini]|uniref:hypothetical protein n=1 Tax=Desulfatiglans anilini TaxID=90728 RepID=UPI0012948230|nr:hypothetical protein [Desulfatiglans anilini]